MTGDQEARLQHRARIALRLKTFLEPRAPSPLPEEEVLSGLLSSALVAAEDACDCGVASAWITTPETVLSVTAAAPVTVDNVARKQSLRNRVARATAPNLIASAVRGDAKLSVTYFEALPSQKRRSLGALVAAASPKEVPVEQRLLDAVTRWLDGADHSAKSFRAVVATVLGPTLEQATKHRSKIIATPFPSKVDQLAAINEALDSLDDLRERLLHAEDDRGTEQGVQAAAWKLSSLLQPSNYRRVVESVVQHARDVLEYKTFDRAKREDRFQEGFTGRRKFNAGDPNGRHSAIDQVILGPEDEAWFLPDRQFGSVRLPATRVRFAGDNPMLPAEWSGSRSFVSYEHRDRKGRVTWHKA